LFPYFSLFQNQDYYNEKKNSKYGGIDSYESKCKFLIKRRYLDSNVGFEVNVDTSVWICPWREGEFSVINDESIVEILNFVDLNFGQLIMTGHFIGSDNCIVIGQERAGK